MLKIVFFAMQVMITLFAIVVLAITYVNPVSAATDELQLLLYIGPALFVVTIPISTLLFNQMLKDKKGQEGSLRQKLISYQSALIMKAALLEIPALAACITAFITGSLTVLLLVPVVLLIFFINRPTLYRLESDLALTRDEVSQLQT